MSYELPLSPTIHVTNDLYNLAKARNSHFIFIGILKLTFGIFCMGNRLQCESGKIYLS